MANKALGSLPGALGKSALKAKRTATKALKNTANRYSKNIKKNGLVRGIAKSNFQLGKSLFTTGSKLARNTKRKAQTKISNLGKKAVSYGKKTLPKLWNSAKSKLSGVSNTKDWFSDVKKRKTDK